MDYESLQLLIKGLSLNNLLNRDFLKSLEDNMEDKRIEVINIQIRVRDDKINDNSDYEIVSLANRNFKDTILKQVIIDADSNETINRFIDSIKQLEE
ncbi:MAG: hypothetical protein IJJ47_08355 [Methanosphaera sp.]|nr:hypothetical protein [Methanosphaera sp.]